MRRRDWQAKTVGGTDRSHGDNFGGGALAIGHMLFADLFADGDDDPLPADHCSEPERERDRNLYPVGNEFRSAVETLLVGAERRYIRLRKIVLLIFLQKTDRLGGEIHVVARIADGRGRDFGEGTVGLDLFRNIANQHREGWIGSFVDLV